LVVICLQLCAVAPLQHRVVDENSLALRCKACGLLKNLHLPKLLVTSQSAEAHVAHVVLLL
jgi:uncharacterized Zn finger protein